MVPVWLADFGDACIWTATAVAVLFVIQYTLSSPWWRDPIGRTIVAEDVALLFLLVPSVILMCWPTALNPLEAELLGIVSLGGVTVVMAWRCIVWWGIRRPAFLQRRADKSEQSTDLGED